MTSGCGSPTRQQRCPGRSRRWTAPGGTNAVSAKLQTLVGKVYDVDGSRVIVIVIDEMLNDDGKRRRAWRLEPVAGMPDDADEPPQGGPDPQREQQGDLFDEPVESDRPTSPPVVCPACGDYSGKDKHTRRHGLGSCDGSVTEEYAQAQESAGGLA